MKKIIVTTTINPPTEAIEKFDAMPDWELIVAGDTNTPKGYKLKRGRYVSPEEQEKYDKELSDYIGWKSIRRRNFAMLMAIEAGADIIATIDDDNIPNENWGTNLCIGKPTEVNYYETDEPVFDSIGATEYKHLWHRGFPLQYLATRDYSKVSKKTIIPDVQADFWNGDPDIDAICRMEHKPECNFKSDSFPMSSSKVSPFNSQNTFYGKKIFRDYFMFPHVGRMDDIWASYYVQINNKLDVVYSEASVYQQRNVHDLMVDFNGEISGYQNNANLIKDLYEDTDNIKKYIPESSYKAFNRYKKLVDKFL